ncbi:Six-hairpin glycosidase-like protein [Dactylonectria macrodidyma]|uniref:Six-hairpin glycosidase-like protein n=1 Tax=Dactylonectria macrodidyma TaxID=307937 RepID=A0A9P9JJQ4_9HYPO|nr:Six-hairpin glycosidase-like protein [Dactylonectria macrodidyma]
MMAQEQGDNQHLHLHYTAPASQWSESLPVGNGRLGATVYGRTDTELLQLNEDSVWYGGPSDRTPRDAQRMLPKLRQLIRDEEHDKAEALVRQAFFASPASMRHYEPLGICTLEFGHNTNGVDEYSRHLDIARSQVVVEYKHQDVSYRRDIIASFPDNALLVRCTSSEPTQFVVRLDRVSDIETETNVYLDDITAKASHIVMHATPGGANSNRLCLVLGVACDDDAGKIEAIGNCLVVTSSSCRIALGAQTTYRHADAELVATTNVDEALAQHWNQLIQRHRADYCRLFNRMSLRMWPDASHIPTDERIRTARDPGLVTLYHNYGRYLLISCSRDAHKALPATLQGIWNAKFSPPWGSKYTININLQMNYWPAAPCSLIDDCTRPVIDLLERMALRGRETAQRMYGCRGWCAHHNTDIWADTSPQDRWMPATLWPLGGLWLSVDMMGTLRYQYDEALHRRIFRIHQGAVEFLLDFLIPSACGQYLVTSPSLSPENTFITKLGKQGVFCEGSAIDMTLIRVAFTQFLWSLDLLGHTSHPLKSKVQDAKGKLPPLILNEAGIIQEWGLNNYEEDEPGHRHVSHLFGLYPADIISPVASPELAEAAKRVLKNRMDNGGGHTGWSRAWLVNFYARLFDGEACGENIDLLLETSTLPNMLDTHPPFQIDGNFGGCAGILECLVQSTETERDGRWVVEVRLLPACPGDWKKGRLEQVRAKQGWLISFQWKDGRVVDSAVVEGTQIPSFDAHVIFPNGKRVIVEGNRVGENHVRCETAQL